MRQLNLKTVKGELRSFISLRRNWMDG